MEAITFISWKDIIIKNAECAKRFLMIKLKPQLKTTKIKTYKNITTAA